MTEIEPLPGPAAPERLDRLRDELARRGLSGFVVPRADEHQGEYVAARSQRLAWLTGFTGSAGMAVVLTESAAIFVDGRYTLQVRSEVDTDRFQPQHLTDLPPSRWLAETLAGGERIGFDPWLHTTDQVEALGAACERAGAELVACSDNPVDAVWLDQPPPPDAAILPHDLAYAGRTAADKRRELAGALAGDRIDAAVLTAPDAIAWLLNIRGGDVAYSPLPLAFALLHGDSSVDLFVAPAKVSDDLARHLGAEVRLAPPDAFIAALEALGRQGKRVRIDPALCPSRVVEVLRHAGAKLDRGTDPCSVPRACKSVVEIDGARNAHRRDGVAMARFLAWLARMAATGEVDELAASDHLERLRAEGALFRGLSFPTISGAGGNGAIVHYRSTVNSNRRLAAGELYLVDSGAQYLDGTTDVTRTVAIGAAGDEERRRFTLVLKGHIALAMAVFPVGTTGSQLDLLARRPLWADGLDYDHGTGHGVGSFLSVHEGPQRISKAGNAVALRPGMIVSNEPGYYKTGAYGIRIENLVLVADAPAPAGAERALLGFETLTLVPIDRALIATEVLTAEERTWLDAYHDRVAAEIGPSLEGGDRAWLDWATRPLD